MNDWELAQECMDELKDVNRDLNPIHFSDQYIKTKKNKAGDVIGVTVLPVMENVKAVLNHYEIRLKYNKLTNKILCFKRFAYIGEMGDSFINDIEDKCIKQDFFIKKEKLTSQLCAIADEYAFNPIEDFLRKAYAKWDGKSRFDELCATLVTDKRQEELKRMYIKKFMITAVALQLSDKPISSQGMFVLQGPQGIGKTTWFKKLVPEHLRDQYFLEGKSLQLNNKVSIVECTSAWITELGEIASTFKKSDMDNLKAHITADKDRLRYPYGKSWQDRRRYVFYVGTVNEEQYLKDETGTRRFWTISVKDVNFNHNINLEQLWGEIVHFWEEGETHWFTKTEIELIMENNKEYEIRSELELMLETYFDFNDDEDRYWMKACDIYQELGMPKGVNAKKLGHALGQLGVYSQDGRSRIRYYAMPPCKFNYNHNEYQELTEEELGVALTRMAVYK